MAVRFVEWAPGVAIPERFSKADEDHFKRVYEMGRKAGREEVRGPICEALGLDEALEDVLINATSPL